MDTLAIISSDLRHKSRSTTPVRESRSKSKADGVLIAHENRGTISDLGETGPRGGLTFVHFVAAYTRVGA